MGNVKDENAKQKILSVATKLFAQKGFDGTSVREICKDAGVNLCLISYYWGGKQELYNGIVEDLIEKQLNYAKSFVDLNLDLHKIDRQEQIKLLYLVLDKFVDFFYSNIPSDLITLLLNAQQKNNFAVKSPLIKFLRRLLAAILNKDFDDKELILKTIFLMGQVNSPRILSAFTLSQLNQESFTTEDMCIIKNNLKNYISCLIKEGENV